MLKGFSPDACKSCEGRGYTVRRSRDFSVAQRCAECMQVCPACNGEGFLFEHKKRGYQSVTPCVRCTNLDRRVQLYNEARLPARYFEKDLFGFEDSARGKPLGNLPKIKRLIYDYRDAFTTGQKGLLMSGRVGTGKTHLLVVLIRYLTLEKGIPCRFIEFTHLLSDLREAYEVGGNAADILNRLADVPVLAIDELGKGRKNDWQLGIIDELISKRYNRCLSTFFTTNYDLHEDAKLKARKTRNTGDQDFRNAFEVETLVDRVGRRIVSRLFEMTEVVEFKAVPDYRAQDTP